MSNTLITLDEATKSLKSLIDEQFEACQTDEDREVLCQALESMFFVKINRKGFTDQKVVG